MKTKDELLKIYSVYLPYELGVQVYADDPQHSRFVNLCAIDTEENYTYLRKPESWYISGLDVEHNMRGNYGILECKPVLYPMDLLTKEIEHKGERFIPIVEILKKTSLLDLSDCKFDVYQDEENFTQVIYVNAEDENDRVIDSMYYDSNIFWHMNNGGDYNPTNPQSEPQEMLLKFHFNVFGLEENEYIQKQSVIQK